MPPSKSRGRERAVSTFSEAAEAGQYLGVDDVGDVAGSEQRHPHVLQQLRQRRLPLLLGVLHPVYHCLEHWLLRVHLQTGGTSSSAGSVTSELLPWSTQRPGCWHCSTASKGAGCFSYKALREIPTSTVNSLTFFPLNLQFFFVPAAEINNE